MKTKDRIRADEGSPIGTTAASSRLHRTIATVALVGLGAILMGGGALVGQSAGAAEDASPAAAEPAQAAGASAGNGYLMMVHATFDPNVYDATSGVVPPATEAVAATNTDGSIVFNVIPHGLDGIAAIVSDPVLEISATVGQERLEVTPNGDPTEQNECYIETQEAPEGEVPEGFGGPLEACLVFHVDATWFEGVPLVDLVLHFADAEGQQVEVNSLPGHLAVHAYQGGAPVDLEQADRELTGSVTPFAIIQYLVDPGV